MYPSKTPWLFVLQLLVIGASVITCLVVTGNPLALLALLLLWQAPPLVPGPDTPAMNDNPDGQEGGQSSNPQGNQIGFVHEQ